jgi:hypothetical protein
VVDQILQVGPCAQPVPGVSVLATVYPDGFAGAARLNPVRWHVNWTMAATCRLPSTGFAGAGVGGGFVRSSRLAGGELLFS